MGSKHQSKTASFQNQRKPQNYIHIPKRQILTRMTLSLCLSSFAAPIQGTEPKYQKGINESYLWLTLSCVHSGIHIYLYID
jgi:hypothetical protein